MKRDPLDHIHLDRNFLTALLGMFLAAIVLWFVFCQPYINAVEGLAPQ